MEMIDNFTPQNLWCDKVPSPSGSDDSGLGWSSDSLADLGFQLDSSKSNNCFNYSETESACSPESQIESNSPDFSPFNQEQKPTSDVCELLDMFEQKPDHNSVNKQANKKAPAKSNSKKRVSTENSQNSKLERCFQPKTGNGKPRQTSTKRKQIQKSSTAYPYPGVRVETVREKLRKMRENRGSPNQPISATIQSLNNMAMSYTNQQSYSMTSPNMSPQQYQQSYNSFQQQPQDTFVPSPSQPATFPQPTSMMSPMPHNSPNYSGPAMSPNMPYELNSGGAAYPPSLPSSSPSRSSTCSPFHQQLPSSPEMSPAIPTPPIPSPVSQYEMNYGAANSNACRSYSNDQTFNYSPLSYEMKQNAASVDEYRPCELPFQDFSNHNQFEFAQGVREIVQSVRRGDLQQLRRLFSCNPELVDTQDEAGKALIFHAVESCQFESVKLLLTYHVNLNLLTAEGNTILHAAAVCPKSDILVLLLKNLQQKEIQILMNKTTIKEGSNPLHKAAEANLINNFLRLLRYGANYLAQDRTGMSPLHIIVRNANVMAVKALLQVAKASNQMAGEKVLQQLTNLRTSHSNTALHYAADLHHSGEEGQRNQFEIVKMLLTNGADPLVVNANGKSPKNLLPQPLLQMVDRHLMQTNNRCGYTAPEMHPFQMGCASSNQYNGAVFSHFQ